MLRVPFAPVLNTNFQATNIKVLLHYPLPCVAYQSPPMPVTEYYTSPSCDDLHHCRTLSNIVWSCVVTVFSCTWIALHPNIPSPDDGSFRIALRRVKLMVMGLIAPELVVAWAMRQWFVSRRLAEKHRGRGWTQSHGFFALMGGFMFFDDGTKHTLTPEELESLANSDKINFPRITKKEIQDRSKGDGLTKGLVIVQTSWFIIQCVARGVERLPITELEVLTLAFAVLNFATYWLWWNKPLNVRCPVHVPTKKSTISQVNDDWEGDMDDCHDMWWGIKNSVLALPGRTWTGVINAMHRARNTELWSVLLPIMDFGMMGGMHSDTVDPGAQSVPVSYAGKLTEEEENLILLTGILVGMTFGAVHCIAWSYQFPSHPEQIIWRSSTVAIICVPVAAAASVAISALTRIHLVTSLGVSSSFLIYVTARAALLVLAFMSLRSLPSGAYQTVDWTTHIPHI